MAEIALFHHAQGLTTGVLDFAEVLRRAGHTVHTPDFYDGQVFDNLEEGLDYARKNGFDTVLGRAEAAVDALPDALVYAGFSLGVMAAQKLAQTRPGARGALLYESFVPPSEFGEWPQGVPVQIHGMDRDPFFAGEGDLDAARAFVDGSADAELFVYPGEVHLFSDNSLRTYDEAQAAVLRERTLAFLRGIG